MFIVIEIQKNAQGQVATLLTAYDSLREAQSKYYTILAAAAKSGLPRHGAAILYEDGKEIASQSFASDGDET